MTSSIRTRRRPGVLIGAVAIAFGLVAAACGGDDGGSSSGGNETSAPSETVGATEAPQETQAPVAEIVPGGKVVFGVEAEVANPWQPAVMQCDSSCQHRARTFFDPVIAIDENLEWQGYLAESIEANADSTVFTIKIREGISFHDGTPVNGAAVIDNLNRGAKGLLLSAAIKDLARDPECYASSIASGNVTGCDLVIEAVDDYTFTISTGFNGDLSQPLSWPLFPYYLGGQWGLIASPTWLAAVDAGTAQASEPVGSGPFVFKSYAPGDNLVVTRNPDYWVKDAEGRNLPYLDEIEFKVINDGQVRATALRSGDLTMTSTSDASVLLDFEGDSDFPTLLQNQYGETNYIMFHLTKPYLSKEVRCALYQAVDKQDLIDVIAGGNADVSNGPFSPGQEGFLTDNGSLPFDPDAAAAAIAEWEAANGELTINYSTTTTATNLATAQYLQAAWGDIGVDVTIDQIEQSKLINNALFGDAAFDAFGWRNHAGLYFDQQYFWWHGSAALPDGALALNFGRLDDPEINRLLEASRSESDADARRALAEEANRRFASECFIIPTSFTKWGVVYSNNVLGIGNSPQASGNGYLRDGAGFPGQVWMTAIHLAP